MIAGFACFGTVFANEAQDDRIEEIFPVLVLEGHQSGIVIKLRRKPRRSARLRLNDSLVDVHTDLIPMQELNHAEQKQGKSRTMHGEDRVKREPKRRRRTQEWTKSALVLNVSTLALVKKLNVEWRWRAEQCWLPQAKAQPLGRTGPWKKQDKGQFGISPYLSLSPTNGLMKAASSRMTISAEHPRRPEHRQQTEDGVNFYPLVPIKYKDRKKRSAVCQDLPDGRSYTL